MPRATGTHIDVYLTNYSQKLTNEGFIADQAFTVVPVNKDSDKFAVYGTEHLKRVQSGRAPGSVANTVDYSVGDDQYSLREHSLRDLVTDEELENADSPLTPREDAVANVRERVLLEREAQAAALYFTSGNWGGNVETLSGQDQFDKYESSRPLEIVREAHNSVLRQSLRKANTIIMGWEVFNKLVEHPTIVDRLKYTSDASVTMQMLARRFDVERVLVGEAVENTANEGQNASLSYIWGRHMWVGYVSPRPGLRIVTAGSMFRGRGFPRVERYRHPDPSARADYVEYGDKWDMHIPHAGAGFLIVNAVAAA